MSNRFRGRRLAIATMHGKDEVMGPLLAEALSVIPFVQPGLDTDQFGTFTQEIPRLHSPLDTARKKALKAIELSGADLAVASEGSFGPHPSVPFLPVDEEIVLLLDARNNHEIIGRSISTKTNFNSREVDGEKALLDFARLAGFPQHGLIIRNKKGHIRKGIQSERELISAFYELMKEEGVVTVETDMRAFMNPFRMEVISMATRNLIDNIASVCPFCAAPGFTVESFQPGLPCSSCGMPGCSPLKAIRRCNLCKGLQEEMFPLGKQVEDPMYCDYCNP